MSNLPGNPFAEGPDNYRWTLHEMGESHLAYEISATLALAYEQRTANLIAVAKWTNGLDVASNLMDQVAERMGLEEWE